MTRERLNEIVRTSGDRLNYALGREAAIEKIADGTAESYIKRADLVSVFGILILTKLSYMEREGGKGGAKQAAPKDEIKEP